MTTFVLPGGRVISLRIKVTAVCLLLLIMARTLAGAAELVSNPSFDNGSTSWTPTVGTGTNFDYTVAGETNGSHAVRVSSRTQFSDGPRQNILAALPASPNPAGEPYRCKLRIKTGTPGFVRCVLQFQYFNQAAGTNIQDVPQIFADQVILASNVWTEVTGAKAILWPTNWTTPPNRAWLRVEVGQTYKENLLQVPTPGNPSPSPIPLTVPAGVFSEFTLDSLSIDRDSDLDGIADSEETNPPNGVTATNPLKADSDDDKLPDWWELKYASMLHPNSPGLDDANADPDGDHFTNWQEYCAGTDPTDPHSKPGAPSHEGLTAAARGVLRWLALLPSQTGRHCAVGQVTAQVPVDFDSQITRLATEVENGVGVKKWPAVLCMMGTLANGQVNMSARTTYLRDYLAAGGIVEVKWHAINPWSGLIANDNGPVGQVDPLGLVKPTWPTYNSAANVAARTNFLAQLNLIADEFEKLLDPLQGGHADNVVIFSPLVEMNGNWFWWGHRPREEYLALWGFIRDHLINTRRLNHVLFSYQAAATEQYYLTAAGSPVPTEYYYPGDDQCDLAGFSLYDDDWVVPYNFDRLWRNYPKPFVMQEAGPDKAHRDGTFSNLTYINQIEARFPRTSYFNVWSTFTNATTRNAIGIVDNAGAVALMTHTSIVTRAEVQWKTAWHLWAEQHFGTVGAAPDGDPDADGVTNLFEYLHASDPLVAEAPVATPFAIDDPSAPGFLTLTVTLNPAATGATLTAESSDEVGSQASWNAANITVLLNQPSCYKVRDNYPIGTAARRFMRLKAELW